MTNKLISVIMPVKNGTNYINEAIDAIRAQNMNIEIIVVDDGSTDNTSDLVMSMGAKVIRHEESKGPVIAKNEALKIATGEYIMFHDHDDIMNEGVLKTMYNELESSSNIAAVMCKVKDFISPDTIGNNNSQIKEDAYYGLFTGAVLIKKASFDIIGLFKEDITAGEIIDWQSRMQSNNQVIKKLDIVATNRRIHNTNFGKTNQETEFADYASILRAKLAAARKAK